MVGCQLWTAYAPCGSQHKDAVQITLEQIDLIKRLVDTYPDYLQLVHTSQGAVCYLLEELLNNPGNRHGVMIIPPGAKQRRCDVFVTLSCTSLPRF